MSLESCNIFGIVWILRGHHSQVRSQKLYAENNRRRREVAQMRSIGIIVGVYLQRSQYHQILKQDIKTYNHYSWTEILAFLIEFVYKSGTLLLEESRLPHSSVISLLKKMTCDH